MRTLAEKLQTTITDFIAQRDALWLLIDSAAAEAPIVFKLLQECERNSRREVFLLFGAPFVNAEQYAEQIVGLFVAEYRALDAARVAQQHAPLERLPEVLLSAGVQGVPTEPAQRIAAVIETARKLLASDGIYRLVSAFWPMEIADPVAYAKLLDALLELSDDTLPGRPKEAPWKHCVRLIGRQVKGQAQASRRAWCGASVLRTASDFSQAALLRSLHETIDDPQQPEAVRMHALFTQATLDQTPNGAAAAIAKYTQVLGYYQKRQNSNMQAVVLIQLGEAYQRQQRLPEARACYEQALAPATAVPVPMCAARLAKNLGEVALLQQRYADAATGYRTWHRLAGQLGDQEGAAAALAKLAVVQECLGRAAIRTPRSRSVETVR